MTSGGPTMQAEDAEVLKTKMKNQKLLTKLNLEKQWAQEHQGRKDRKNIDLE